MNKRYLAELIKELSKWLLKYRSCISTMLEAEISKNGQGGIMADCEDVKVEIFITKKVKK